MNPDRLCAPKNETPAWQRAFVKLCQFPRKLPRKKIWSGRRGSNPRPRPWQGRALPLSYTRIRDGGECSPSTADLCQMRTVNATVRVRFGGTRINPISLTNGERIGPKQRLNGVCRPLKPTPGTQRGAIRAIFPDRPPNAPCQFGRTPPSQVPRLAPTGRRRRGVPSHPVSDAPEDVCRLNFAAKPPSSG